MITKPPRMTPSPLNLGLDRSPAAQYPPPPPLSRRRSPQVRLPLMTVSAKRYFHATADELNDDPYIEGKKLVVTVFLSILSVVANTTCNRRSGVLLASYILPSRTGSPFLTKGSPRRGVTNGGPRVTFDLRTSYLFQRNTMPNCEDKTGCHGCRRGVYGQDATVKAALSDDIRGASVRLRTLRDKSRSKKTSTQVSDYFLNTNTNLRSRFCAAYNNQGSTNRPPTTT